MRNFDRIFQGEIDSDEILDEASSIFGGEISGEFLLGIVLRKAIQRIKELEEKSLSFHRRIQDLEEQLND